MKPQDILVLLKLHLWNKGRWRLVDISSAIGLSVSETHGSIRRAEKAGLYDRVRERPRASALEEFLLYGVKYMYAVERGERTIGLKTAHSAPPLSQLLVAEQEDVFVWPFEEGGVSGYGIKPLYRSAPQASLQDFRLYEFLALIDSLRIGKAREVELAQEEIRRRLR